MKREIEKINQIIDNISGWSIKETGITVYTEASQIVEPTPVLIIGEKRIKIEIVYSCGTAIPHVQSELSKTNAGYWKARCEAAEIIIQLYSQEPTDPFESLKATGEWNRLRSTPEPPSEISTKIAEIERQFTDGEIRDLNPIWVRNEILKRLKGE